MLVVPWSPHLDLDLVILTRLLGCGFGIAETRPRNGNMARDEQLWRCASILQEYPNGQKIALAKFYHFGPAFLANSPCQDGFGRIFLGPIFGGQADLFRRLLQLIS